MRHNLAVEGRPSQNQRHLRLPPNHQPRQHNPAAINPSAQFLRSDCPILLVDPPPQRGCLQAARAEIKSEIDDGREPSFWLGGQ